MKRKEFLNLLNLASAALASEGEGAIKVYQNFCFTKKSILAYNDVIGIRLKNPGTVFHGIAPGRLLLKFVKSCTGENIEFVDAKKEAKWRLQSGPTKLDFGYQPEEEFPFNFPKFDDNSALELEDSFFEGLDLVCSVISERGFSAWTSGVILHFTDEKLILGATSGNRNSIHVYEIEEEVDVREQVIMPISFCKTVLDMRKSFKEARPNLIIVDNYVVVKFGDWNAVFGRVIISDEKVRLVEQALELVNGLGEFVPISDKVREILERADSIAGKDGDSILTIDDDNRMLLQTKTVGGIARDALSLEEKHPPVKVRISPGMVTLKMDKCAEFFISQRLIGMRSEDQKFVRLIANRT